MRTRLVKSNIGERYTFFGTFDRVSMRYDRYKGTRKYIIITNITDEYGNYVSNYATFDYIKGFADLPLNPGDRVSFRARVVGCQDENDPWYGLYPDTELMYRLMNPTKVIKLINPIMRLR